MSLRRRSILNASKVSLEKVDDAREREQRRSDALIQRRLSVIPSPANTSTSVDEEEVNSHVHLCMKLFSENKISVKNVWNLRLIDYLDKLKDSLAVAGTSLEIGAKIFGLKVDDTHNEGIKLATTFTMTKKNEDVQQDGEADDDNKENEAVKKKKKPKRLVVGQKARIVKNSDMLMGPVPKTESTYFQTQSRCDLSAIDNLFTNRFPMDSSGCKFLFNGKEQMWTSLKDEDPIVDGEQKIFQVVVPKIVNFKLCLAFADFDLVRWNPDEDEMLMNESQKSFRINDEPLCCEEGLPVAELDGSIHDIFANQNDGVDGDSADQHDESVEEEPIVAHFQDNVEHIVSFRPNNVSDATEYSYNRTINTNSGKIIDQIWAGPSHWKLKYIRASTARFSGKSLSSVQQVDQLKHQAKKRKTKAMTTSLNFFIDVEDVTKKTAKKKHVKSVDPKKIILPPRFDIDLKRALLPEPLIAQRKSKDDKLPDDCEVKPYNYDNPNDSFYCSQKGSDDRPCDEADDDDGVNGEAPYLDGAVEEDVNFADGNLIQAPEMVPTDYIQYAKQVKRMDMKKLKIAVWTCLTDDRVLPDRAETKVTVEEHNFLNVYKKLPKKISERMRKDLSCSLAFAALLHLANEHSLKLTRIADGKDILIRSAKGVGDI